MVYAEEPIQHSLPLAILHNVENNFSLSNNSNKKYQLYFDTLLDSFIDTFLAINEIHITLVEGKNDYDNEQ